ncbi:MAG: hypothetical protein JWO38_1391, partial [Gemmataceae bacterium]|nr:hypothetical protein [Gemmataceae bacterium]MDB5307189.1 hypothetical protein [Gemmataceae bacterium]
MRRMLGAVAVGLFATAVVQAHFPFIIPEA